MEYIDTLVASNSLKTGPTDISNKEDLITKGVDFADRAVYFDIDIPEGGAIIRDFKVFSNNVVQIEIIFQAETGGKLYWVNGAPEALPISEFPTERIGSVTITIVRTQNNEAPQDVTLSVIACADAATPGTTPGMISVILFF